MTYELYIEPEVFAYRQKLPGVVRQQIRWAIESLATEPRPAHSRILDISGLVLPTSIEIRRIRLDRWRVVYAVNDSEQLVRVLGIYQRPPYDYDDLADLIARLN